MTSPPATDTENRSDVVAIDLDPATFPRSVLKWGWLIIGLLAIADIALNHFGGLPSPLRRSVNIAREDAIGTWFSVVQLLATAVVTWLLYRASKKGNEPKTNRRVWAVLTGYFVYMSLDDAAVIHERMGSTFADSVSFFPSYAWQVVYAPVFLIFGLIMLYAMTKLLDSRASQKSILLGLAFLAFAVILDFGEGVEGLHLRVGESVGLEEGEVSHFQKVLEEAVEMAGFTLFLSAFVRQYANRVATTSINFLTVKD